MIREKYGDGAPQAFKDKNTGFAGWRVQLEPRQGVPTPAVSDGRVFVGGGFGTHDFFAFDARTGTRAWHLHTKDDGPTAAVLAEEFVAFNTESCTLVVVDAVSGTVAWERWLGDPLLAQPAVMDGRVFMAYPTRLGHRLGAFALKNGSPLWETRLDHDVITAPVVAEGKVYLSTFDGMVWCIDPQTGKVLWTQQLQATSAPWVFEGDIYVARRKEGPRGERQAGPPPEPKAGESSPPPSDSPLEWIARHDSASGRWKSSSPSSYAAYLSSDSGKARKRAYHQMDSSVGFAHAPESAKLHVAEKLIGENLVSRAWRFQGSRPVVVNGIQYDTAGDRLEASDARTGEILWTWRDAEAIEGERRLTPPAAANGRVWAGTWDGRVISWDGLTGDIRWQVKVGAPCHWQPAIYEGWVFAGLEDGTLLGFATADVLDTDWPMWGGGCGHNGKPIPQSQPQGDPTEGTTPSDSPGTPKLEPEPVGA
jgi:Ca-activated chloride channel homolog